MANVSVRQALQYVADHPVPATDELVELPAWEHIARALFVIANSPDAKVRGSMVRATKAQKLILDRMVGLRAAGTNPAAIKNVEVEFVDLTQGVLGA